MDRDIKRGQGNRHGQECFGAKVRFCNLDDFTDTVIAVVNYSLDNVDFVENLTLSSTATQGTGNDLNNVLTGNSSNNLLSGLGGNDTLIGAGGDDDLDGGTGASDVAQFTGPQTDYLFLTDGTGAKYVADTVFGRDGTDKLVNIEKLAFNNQSSTTVDVSSINWDTVRRQRQIEVSRHDAPVFNSANYSANGAMTWTVQQADELVRDHHRQGRLMVMNFEIENSSVGGTVDVQLKIKIPNNQKALSISTNMIDLRDNGNRVPARAFTAAGSQYVYIRKQDGSNFTASTNNTDVKGQLAIICEPV